LWWKFLQVILGWGDSLSNIFPNKGENYDASDIGEKSSRLYPKVDEPRWGESRMIILLCF